MNVDTTRIIEELEKMDIVRENEVNEKTLFSHVISRIDDKWDLLSPKEQSRVCFLLSALSLRPLRFT